METFLKKVAEKNKSAIEIISVNSNQPGQDIYLIKKPVIFCETKFYVLIYNSSGHKRVAYDMKKQCGKVIVSSYERVIGLQRC